MPTDLFPREKNGGRVAGSVNEHLMLSLSNLADDQYGLAQVDNYVDLARHEFPYQAPVHLKLEARVSEQNLPGTWGFGFWNDPFSFGFSAGGMSRILPVLPNAVWFFYGSRENYLSLADETPGAGFQAKTWCSSQMSAILSLLAAPGLLLSLWPTTARLLRRLARNLIKEASTELEISVGHWHSYELIWMENQVVFRVDQLDVLQTALSPSVRLGLVLWMDNQYFRFDPAGKLGFGFLSVPKEQWLQIKGFEVTLL